MVGWLRGAGCLSRNMSAPADKGAEISSESLQLNDEVVDMLMLLDYETEFCNKELKPLPRTFFVQPAANTAYQFKYFTQLVLWLFKKVRVKADWDEYDDPNTVITNMLVNLKDTGIQVNAVPGKLKLGYGESVCMVLNSLLKEVLRRIGFQWGSPTYPDEGMADEAEVDSDAEIASEIDEAAGDGEEDELMYEEDEAKRERAGESDDEKAVLEATVDPKEWLLEVERVGPKLRVPAPNDGKEWRTHLQQTRTYKQVIDTQFPPCKAQLDKLSKELSSHCERIKAKEAFINTQFDQRALDYRQQQEELATVQTQYTELAEVVMNLQIEHKAIVEELDLVKADMEERSSTVTDTAPIVKMKDAFKKLRSDTRQLEVRIGVVSHTLMQAKLRQRPQEDRKGGVFGSGMGMDGDYDDAP